MKNVYAAIVNLNLETMENFFGEIPMNIYSHLLKC